MPVAKLTEVAEPLVAVHGQSDQHRLLLPRAQRDALDRFGGDAAGQAAGDLRRDLPRARGHDRASSRRSRPRPASGPARPTCCASASARSRRSRPSRARTTRLAAEESRLGFADTLRTAAEQAREALSSESGGPDALATTSAARGFLDSVRDHDPEAAELADRLAEVTYLVSDVAADVASYASRLDTDPARLAAVSERRAALTALTRKYGDSIDEVLAWAEQSATRLLDLDGTDERIADADRRARPARAPTSTAAAAALSKARTKAARRLEKQVTAELDAARDAPRPPDDRGHPDRAGGPRRRRRPAAAGRQHRLRAAPAATRAPRAASCPG